MTYISSDTFFGFLSGMTAALALWFAYSAGKRAAQPDDDQD